MAGVSVRTTDPRRVIGAKPATFAGWMFRLLGAGLHPDDTLADLFPGSGGIARAWASYVSSSAASDASRLATAAAVLRDVSCPTASATGTGG